MGDIQAEVVDPGAVVVTNGHVLPAPATLESVEQSSPAVLALQLETAELKHLGCPLQPEHVASHVLVLHFVQ